VHITGGGGEQGFASRTPEIEPAEILAAGVSTVAGLLGADGCTRSLEALYAKAGALEAAGITSYIYSGSYAVPPLTFTGNLSKDLVLIDKVIGAGEIAISDHRSSQPPLNALLSLASQSHLGGLIGGKAGVVHFHVGDGKSGLAPLLQIIEQSDLPVSMFVPTHLNRSTPLFEQASSYLKAGGNIDLTAGEKVGISVPDAVERLIKAGMDMSRVTVARTPTEVCPTAVSAKSSRFTMTLEAALSTRN
jgi:beta-aspartyl-dipeptidase (metallo-type)